MLDIKEDRPWGIGSHSRGDRPTPLAQGRRRSARDASTSAGGRLPRCSERGQALSARLPRRCGAGMFRGSLPNPGPRVSDPRHQLQADLADRYVIERELGRGGMATVYLARDLKHHRLVAVKVLRPELAYATRDYCGLHETIPRASSTLASGIPCPRDTSDAPILSQALIWRHPSLSLYWRRTSARRLPGGVQRRAGGFLGLHASAPALSRRTGRGAPR